MTLKDKGQKSIKRLKLAVFIFTGNLAQCCFLNFLKNSFILSYEYQFRHKMSKMVAGLIVFLLQ